MADGRAIPVVDLARLMGEPPAGARPANAALLVERDGDWLGFGLHRCMTVETASARPRLPGGQAADEHVSACGDDTLDRVLRRRDLAELGADEQCRLVRVSDLQAVAQALGQAQTHCLARIALGHAARPLLARCSACVDVRAAAIAAGLPYNPCHRMRSPYG